MPSQNTAEEAEYLRELVDALSSVGGEFSGRGGLGSVLVFAAGNDGLANQTSDWETVTIVGASNQGDNWVSWSHTGIGIDCIAPGTNRLPRLHRVGRIAMRPYIPILCTHSQIFACTSSGDALPSKRITRSGSARASS